MRTLYLLIGGIVLWFFPAFEKSVNTLCENEGKSFDFSWITIKHHAKITLQIFTVKNTTELGDPYSTSVLPSSASTQLNSNQLKLRLSVSLICTVIQPPTQPPGHPATQNSRFNSRLSQHYFKKLLENWIDFFVLDFTKKG